MEWKRKESWFADGSSFRIEICHWECGGEHKWNVYVYVYPNHPMFNTLKDDYEQLFPFHGGCSYHCFHHKDGKICSKQYGSDYGHFNDSCEHIATLEQAHEMQHDALTLYKFMEEYRE